MIIRVRVPGLLPYAAVAVVIVAASSVAIVSTVRPAGLAPSVSAAATPASAAREKPELSKTSRLAYWRDRKLWVSDLSGSLRYAVASTDDMRRISLTRWAASGTAVAFVESGLSLAVVGIDGTRTDVDLPLDLRNNGYRISDVRWSPDARRVAATLLRPGDGRSDAFIVDLTASRPAWSRLTSLEDLFIGEWISNEELLAHTAAGVIGIVGTRAPNTMRLITGATGVSPIIGPEGRIHFLLGRVLPTRDPSLPFVTANRASVWSAATDGSDMRRETTWEVNDIRLDARLPDGRYLAHRGSSTAQGSISEDLDLLPTSGGVIERVRVSPEGRTAYGFAPERIVRIDLTKPVAGPGAAAGGAVTVFLETSGDADIWFPTSLSLARGGETGVGAPAARYVLTLGSHIWQMEAGVATLLRPAPVLRRNAVPPPRWSPAGDKVAVVEQAGPTASSTTFVAVVLDRGGDAARLAQTLGAGRSLAWSPTGAELAVVVDRRGSSGVATDAQLEVRFQDPTGRVTRPPIAGSEVAWTAKGLLVLASGPGARAATTLLRVEGEAPPRTLVTREQLAADPRAGAAPSATAALGSLDASRDGQFASVRLQVQEPSSTRSFWVLLGPDGAPLQYLRSDTVADLAWSPTRPLLGYTFDLRTANERTQVVSPTTGEPVVATPGRFAGWSPDGQWYYVGRVEGLFAYPLAGGQPVRVGPAGVPVSAAPR